MSDKKQLTLHQLPPVHLRITWSELFGTTIKDLTHGDRKARWEELKKLNPGLSGRWEDEEVCSTCKHVNRGWCELQGLPCAFNPIMKDYGMACMGVGYEKGSSK